jgi:phosphatidylserine/phosphatidylglycerophosphate/cardiolipin synthase-like enzyme
MLTAHFHDIRSTILSQIDLAQQEIRIAVAWFTSKTLLSALQDKLAEGTAITVITSDDQINRRLHKGIRAFVEAGGQWWVIPSGDFGGLRFLHEKFALFDGKRLLMGSYNWTENAEYHNHESLIETDESLLVQPYRGRFRKLESEAMPYREASLERSIAMGEAQQEEQFEALLQELEAQMEHTLTEAQRLGAKLNYPENRAMIARNGGITTINRLVGTGMDSIQPGFMKLWEKQRLDLTFEAIAIKTKFRTLFREQTLEKAEERLRKFNVDVEAWRKRG